MSYLQGLRSAIEYVEEHISDEIDFDEVSKCARMSKSSFQRFFLLIVDMTFSEYIRKRRIDFSERWFKQGGIPDGFKMWVPILKK